MWLGLCPSTHSDSLVFPHILWLDLVKGKQWAQEGGKVLGWKVEGRGIVREGEGTRRGKGRQNAKDRLGKERRQSCGGN